MSDQSSKFANWMGSNDQLVELFRLVPLVPRETTKIDILKKGLPSFSSGPSCAIPFSDPIHLMSVQKRSTPARKGRITYRCVRPDLPCPTPSGNGMPLSSDMGTLLFLVRLGCLLGSPWWPTAHPSKQSRSPKYRMQHLWKHVREQDFVVYIHATLRCLRT